MKYCKNCNNLYNLSDENDVIVGKWCPKINDSPDLELERDCEYYTCLTNADRIRSMTDEELANIIMCPNDIDADLCCSEKTCFECSLEWLQSEVKPE